MNWKDKYGENKVFLNFLMDLEGDTIKDNEKRIEDKIKKK